MSSRKPEQKIEYPTELPEERLQWVVPDRTPRSPSPPAPWRPTSDITVTFPERQRSRLH
jgi:hypothetical protein